MNIDEVLADRKRKEIIEQYLERQHRAAVKAGAEELMQSLVKVPEWFTLSKHADLDDFVYDPFVADEPAMVDVGGEG